jgi:putative ABC transport system permease protein
MLEFVFRNISQRKTRTSLTVLGILIGVATIISLVSISEGLEAEATKAFETIQGINVHQRGVQYSVFSRLPSSYVDEIEKIRGVKLANPRIDSLINSIDGEEIGLLADPSQEGGLSPPSLVGYDPAKIVSSPSATIPKNMKEGRFLSSRDRNSAVIGKVVAERFGKRVGSVINVDGYKLKIVGIYETGSEFIDTLVVVPINKAREIAELDPDEISSIYVDVENPSELEKIARKIELRLPVEASTPQEISEHFSSLLSTIRTVTWVISSIAAIVGGIGVTNSMLMNVAERRKEIGILKAVGWTNREVIRSFLLESFLIGLIGGALGICAGIFGVTILKEFLPGFTFRITPRLLALTFCFAISLGIFGGLYPAWKSTKIQPVEALRYE